MLVDSKFQKGKARSAGVSPMECRRSVDPTRSHRSSLSHRFSCSGSALVGGQRGRRRRADLVFPRSGQHGKGLKAPEAEFHDLFRTTRAAPAQIFCKLRVAALPARADRSTSGLCPTFHLPIKDQAIVRDIANGAPQVRTGLTACPEIMLMP